MSENRRGFLRQLASLPLVGGSVGLIGQPTAVAEPVTPDMVEAYKTWLHYEREWLTWQMADDPVHQMRYGHMCPPDDRKRLHDTIKGCLLFVGRSGSYHGDRERLPASSRAALVLSAVGCDWHDKRHAGRWDLEYPP